MADVIVSKLANDLPLHGQEQRYARQVFSIARSTLCGWLRRVGPHAFLKDFRGYLHCDVYAEYDELFPRSDGTIIEVGCYAYTRRKFVDTQ